MRGLTLGVAVVVIAMLATVATCENLQLGAGLPGRDATRARKPRSVVQACIKDIKKVCNRTEPVFSCLERNTAAISDVCKEWVAARKSCQDAVQQISSCNSTKISFRRCLRQVPASELPESCTGHDFYKSAVVPFAGFKTRGTKKPRQAE